jgi:hypothetical protein
MRAAAYDAAADQRGGSRRVIVGGRSPIERYDAQLSCQRARALDLVEEFWSLFNEGRHDEAIGMCAADFEYVDNQNAPEPLDAGGTLAAMRQLLEAAPDRPVTITRRFDGTDGSGVLEMTWKGTFACFSTPTTTGTIVVFDTRDAKLVRQRLYYG